MNLRLPLSLMLVGCFFVLAHSQSWQAEFDNGADFLRYESTDGKYIIGTTKKDICVLSGEDGQKVWSGTFKELAEVKSCESQYFMEEAGVLFLADKKSGKDNILCIDITNGKVLWKTDRFEGVNIYSTVYFPNLKAFAVITKNGLVALDARSGETQWEQARFTGALADWQYLPESNELILVNYKTSWGALFSGFKNQLMKLNAATGELLWETEYFGVIPQKHVTGQIISEMYVEGDRIFCLINGMQVFDLKSGSKLWTAEFDLFDHKILIGGDAFFYDGVAHPLVDGGDVYLVRFKQGSSKVILEKRRMEDGTVQWSREMDSKPDAVPTMALADGKLVLQLGGQINTQGSTSEGSFNKYKWMDPFRIEVYDAATGNFVWKSEKLNDRITRPVVKENTVYVADEKKFYAFDVNTGAVKYEAKLGDLKTGEAKELYDVGDNIGIMGEKGFAMVNASGQSTYFIKMKEPYNGCPVHGDHLLIMNDDELRVVSLLNGTEKMLYKKEKDYRYSFSPDGSYLITMSPKSVNRFSLL